MYWVLYWIVRVFVSLFFRLEVTGLSNIPKSGPAIFAVNHISGFDPPTVGAVIPRKIHFMAKTELFDNAILRTLLRWGQAYPVQRNRPDRRAIRHSLQLLADGEAILMFPEGHRSDSGELQQARAGVIYLAQKSGCPVVPIGVAGSYRFRHSVAIKIGPSFHISREVSKEAAQNFVMEQISGLVNGGQIRQKL